MSGSVTSVAALVNPGLDLTVHPQEITPKVERSVGSTAQSRERVLDIAKPPN